MATLELEKTILLGAEEEQKHNAMIKERYRRLQDAEAYQFTDNQPAETSMDTVRASVLAPETPVYNAPDAPTQEQLPQVTQFVRARIDSPVFTTEKFNAVQEEKVAQEVVDNVAVEPMVAPVEIYASRQAVATEAQYSLSAMAKVVLAAFVATVIAMLTLICVNTQLIRIKNVRIQNLEEKRDQLVEEVTEIQRRIEMAQSEEAIRQYALSNGMILAND